MNLTDLPLSKQARTTLRLVNKRLMEDRVAAWNFNPKPPLLTVELLRLLSDNELLSLAYMRRDVIAELRRLSVFKSLIENR